MNYCPECWWSDKTDNKAHGVDYNPNKDFFDQFRELSLRVPRESLIIARNVDCNYLNLTADNKGCYMIIESSNNEDCINCYWIQLSKNLVDSSFTNKVELSYEVDDCYDSFGLSFSKGCYNCLNSAFLVDCRGCTDCLGCVNLRQKKYHIFNEQFTKKEYEDKLKNYRLDTYSGLERFKKEFAEFVKNKPRKFAELSKVVNSTGNYMTNVKNNRYCFHSYDAEENAYSEHVWRGAKECVDCSTAGRSAELIYNSLNMGMQVASAVCCFECWSSQFMEYCISCPSSNNCFGCIGLEKSSYCILNKQYSKEEYRRIRSEIVEKLTEKGEYGNFFPRDISTFGYNESSAMDQFPLNKEEAIAQGYKWEDTPRGTFGQETVAWRDFPDSILDLPEDFDVNKEVFVCTECKKNYRIIDNELIFYRRMKIPIPRNCPECRHVIRFKNRGPNKLWHRQCMCDKQNHDHEGRCSVDFETSYAPERPEIVYCEKCYQKEVY